MHIVVTATPSEAPFAPILLRGSVEHIFRKAREFGYDKIELHLRNPGEVEQEKIARACAQYEMPVSALGTGMAARLDGLTFSDPDAAVRKRAKECMKAFIRLAAALSSSIIIGSFNGNIGREQSSANQRRQYHFECLTECAAFANSEGVTLLVEPCNRYECDWLQTTEQAITLLNQLGHANVRYLADTFHMNIEEVDICQSLRAAAANLGHVHLVDSNRRIPGDGHSPMGQIIETLGSIAYDGALSFECVGTPDPEAAADKAVKYVRTLLS